MTDPTLGPDDVNNDDEPAETDTDVEQETGESPQG